MFTQDLPVRLAVYKFKLEWFKASSRRRFPVEYRYDLGEAVRNHIIDLSSCVVLGTEYKDFNEKFRYYDAALPPHKRMVGRDNGIGVCIGNRASQFLCNIVTTPMLEEYKRLGVGCSLYTDDCAGVTRNKRALTKYILPTIKKFIWEVCGLTLHPHKVYIQHASKGINFLAYRIKNGRITPSKRIVHNIRWYIARITAFYKGRPKLLAKNAEKVMQVVNYYFGLLKWCSAYRIRRWMRRQLILTEGFGKVFNITDTKITIRKKLTKYSHALEANRKRKLKLKFSLI